MCVYSTYITCRSSLLILDQSQSGPKLHACSRNNRFHPPVPPGFEVKLTECVLLQPTNFPCIMCRPSNRPIHVYPDVPYLIFHFLSNNSQVTVYWSYWFNILDFNYLIVMLSNIWSKLHCKSRSFSECFFACSTLFTVAFILLYSSCSGRPRDFNGKALLGELIITWIYILSSWMTFCSSFVAYDRGGCSLPVPWLTLVLHLLAGRR